MSPSRPAPRHPLCDAARSGLYRSRPESLPALRQIAADAGLMRWRLDLDDFPDELSLFAGIAEALRFPSWFGHNRDALTDCLLDLSWCKAKGYVLEIEHFQGLQTRLPDTGEMLLEIFAHCASVWAGDGIPFWVLFGRGAPAHLPRLDGSEA